MSKPQATDIQKKIGVKRWINELRRKNLLYTHYRPRKKLNSKKTYEYIIFPKTFCVYNSEENKGNSYTETLNIIHAIQRLCYLDQDKILLDFSMTDTLKAAALLLLYATIEDLISAKKTIKISKLSKSFNVNRILKNSGFIRLCNKNIIPPNFDGEYMPVVSGTGGDYRDEIVDFIQHQIYKSKMSPSTESIYGDAIQEAINNVAYHAYPGIPHELKKWWVKCDLAGDQLYLVIYDKGVGIPKTVMNKIWFLDTLKTNYPEINLKVMEELRISGTSFLDIIRYKIGLVNDAIKIAISMTGDVTGTAQSKHGQGSKSIKALVNSNEKGTLWVYSNDGLYKIKNGIADTINLPKSIPGTLIQWNIKVKYEN